MKEAKRNLTSGRLLARNTIWNLLGQLLPIAAGFACVPPLVRGLGVDRFGVLSLAWIVIGYFSFFDLGLGRALTKLMADRMGEGEEQSLPSLVWTSLLLMFLLGIAGGIVISAISPTLIHRMLRIPKALQDETLSSFYLLASSIPLVTLGSGLRGVLEAQQRFRIANLIRVPMSIFLFAGPLLVLPFSHTLVAVVWVLVAGRFVSLVAHFLACFHTMPNLLRGFSLNRAIIRPLAQFGGWMTLSNIAGPMLYYVDRFLIGAQLSVSAVAYYSAPFDTVTRLTVIPVAVAGVLFPAFAMSLRQNPGHTDLLLSRGVKYVLLALFPIVLTVVLFAPEVLGLWLGPVFAQNGTSVLRWLAAGVFVNGLAILPFVLIQSAGKPDFTAKLCLAELPPYLAALWLLTRRFGIQGTAMVWFGRVVLEGMVLFLYACRIVPTQPRFLLKLSIAVPAGLTLMYLATLPAGLTFKAVFLTLTLIAFGFAAWSWALGPRERTYLAENRLVSRAKAHTNSGRDNLFVSRDH
jgi:O-antigen/teichoic acid export membrane protein